MDLGVANPDSLKKGSKFMAAFLASVDVLKTHARLSSGIPAIVLEVYNKHKMNFLLLHPKPTDPDCMQAGFAILRTDPSSVTLVETVALAILNFTTKDVPLLLDIQVRRTNCLTWWMQLKGIIVDEKLLSGIKHLMSIVCEQDVDAAGAGTPDVEPMPFHDAISELSRNPQGVVLRVLEGHLSKLELLESAVLANKVLSAKSQKDVNLLALQRFVRTSRAADAPPLSTFDWPGFESALRFLVPPGILSIIEMASVSTSLAELFRDLFPVCMSQELDSEFAILGFRAFI
jgi:hypothetical protein